VASSPSTALTAASSEMVVMMGSLFYAVGSTGGR